MNNLTKKQKKKPIAKDIEIFEAEIRKKNWDDFFANTTKFPDDFLADRNDTPPQERRLFDDC